MCGEVVNGHLDGRRSQRGVLLRYAFADRRDGGNSAGVAPATRDDPPRAEGATSPIKSAAPPNAHV